MTNFWQRTLTGTLYVAVIILSIIFDSRIFFLVFAVVTALTLAEFLGHTIKDNAPLRNMGILTGLTIYLGIGSVFFQLDLHLLPVIIILPSLLIILGLFNLKTDHFKNMGMLLLGIFYIVIPFSFLPGFESLNTSENSFHPLLAIFILFWANDTGAYLVGRSMGKTPLFSAVSPKKTIEGLVGGIIIVLGTAYVISLFENSLSLLQWMITGLIISVFGTLGDLVESQFKRKLGIKDSGKILPGHGGLLDRFDGFFIAIPLIYTYIFLM